MNNRNRNIKWADENGIAVDPSIVNNVKQRGIYGIFVEDECVYVGRSTQLYSRVFKSEGHIQKLRYRQHVSKLLDGLDNHKPIRIEVLEEVPEVGDYKAKDAQRLNSRESHWLDYYQARNQCLEQYPEGRWG